jgi:two-component system, OmpR family, alkaline phosphatase synthesis response regulator PhoP
MVYGRCRILLIDRDEELTNSLKNQLEKEAYEVLVVRSAEKGIEAAMIFNPHLIITEIKLQGMDGVEACIELRKRQKLRKSIIAFYTSVQEDYSQIAAFNAGADDYIRKPVNLRVLVHRIKALIKRYFSSYKVNDISKITGDIRIDREKFLLYKQDNEIVLPRKEFELIALLATDPKKVFSRNEIMLKVWGHEYEPKNRTIDVHIRKIREKVGEEYIKTVKGVGYRLK